jgi:hypothetical protein
MKMHELVEKTPLPTFSASKFADSLPEERVFRDADLT